MTTTPVVSEGQLRGEQLEAAVQVSVRAFDDDPFFEYLFPGTAQRHRAVAMLHRTVLRHVAAVGVTRTAFVDGQVAGLALWVPPGKWPYSPLLQLRQLVGGIAAFAPNLSSLSRGRPIMHAVVEAHPKRAQWYLQLLMVDPPFQRLGIGSMLQTPTLAVCDREGVFAWVETQKEENLAYYRRFGFEVVAEHRPVADAPAMWSLGREARPAT
jgi:GNAT superfamily N-acetyltransferase